MRQAINVPHDPIDSQIPVQHLSLPFSHEQNGNLVIQKGSGRKARRQKELRVQGVGIVQHEIAFSGGAVQGCQQILQYALQPVPRHGQGQETGFQFHGVQHGREFR